MSKVMLIQIFNAKYTFMYNNLFQTLRQGIKFVLSFVSSCRMHSGRCRNFLLTRSMQCMVGTHVYT